MNNVAFHANQYFTDYGHVIDYPVGYLKLEQDDAEESEEIEKLMKEQRRDEEERKNKQSNQQTKQ